VSDLQGPPDAVPIGSTVTVHEAAVRILVVDDNETKRLALRSALEPLGYSLVEATSGLEALRCVMEQDFAVILLDVCMPSMDGFETAALIRKRLQSEMTPIIFITAFVDDEANQGNHYAQGAVDFMSAPVAPDELRAKVSVFANLFQKASSLAEQMREVQASADQLRLLTDAAPVGIFQTDHENRYVYTNPRWTEITGIRAEDAAGWLD
jgi:CheY-like chemotaxis protein